MLHAVLKGGRRTASGWVGGALAAFLVIGSLVASAPVATAGDGGLTAPLGQSPVGALVQGVWDDSMFAVKDDSWFVTRSGGASWSALDEAEGISERADLVHLDARAAVFLATQSGEDDDGNSVTDSTLWLVDHQAEQAGIDRHDFPGRDVVSADGTKAIVAEGGAFVAVDLATSLETGLQTEPGVDGNASWWELGSPQALLVGVTYASDSMTPVRSTVDPVPLDGNSAGDAAFEVPGGLYYAGWNNGIEYLVLKKTSGASTFEFDYCTRATGASTSVCNVLKSGISTKSFQQLAAGKVGHFAQMQVGGSLYVTDLTRNPLTGKLPATVKVTGVNADHFPDGTRTRFAMVGSHARPIVADTTLGSGGVFEVGPTGKAVRISTGPTGPVVPDQLSLSASRVAGVDGRGAGTAWVRDLSALGSEQVMSTRGREALVSAGRTALNSADGLVLTDQGARVAKLPAWSVVGEFSGPYLIGYPKAKSGKPTVLAGTRTLAFGKYDYPLALFGSVVAAITYGSTDWWITLYDVSTGTPAEIATVDISDYSWLDSVYVWGDNVAVSGYTDPDSDETLARVTNFRTGDLIRQRAFPFGGGVYGLGDGVALLGSDEDPDWQLLDLGSGAVASLDGASDKVIPAFDGAGRVAFATDSSLVVRQLSFAGSSAPRALWSSAQASFNSNAGESSPFRVSVDATKALAGGALVIDGQGPLSGTSVFVPVKASSDGSLRMSWDGKVEGDNLVAPAGTYAWRLEGFDGLVAVDGTTALGGTFTVTNDPVPYPQVAPVIDKTKPATGQVLTADAGPHPSDATIDYQWYAGTTAIPDGKAATYEVRPADVGKTLKVKVTFSGAKNYLGSSRTSAATSKVAKGTMVKGTVTMDDPAPQVDAPVSAVLDGWGPAPVTPTYQWYRVSAKNKATAISKQTKAVYIPTGADVGYRLKVVATGTKPGYTSAAVSSPLSPVVLAGAYQSVPTPEVTGTARVDMTLRAVPGTYASADGAEVAPSFGYQWYRVNGAVTTAIKGATGPTYRATAADLGLTLKVRVTAKRSGYPTATTDSGTTDPVAAPMKAGTVTIGGVAATGSELTATIAGWVPEDVTVSYQWYRGTTSIANADTASYTPGAADLGKKLRVRVTGAADGYASVTVYSAYTVAVVAGK